MPVRNTFSTARLRLAAVALAGAVAIVHAGQDPAQPAPQQPTFKAQVEYVEVDALVSDATGTFVRGLKK